MPYRTHNTSPPITTPTPPICLLCPNIPPIPTPRQQRRPFTNHLYLFARSASLTAHLTRFAHLDFHFGCLLPLFALASSRGAPAGAGSGARRPCFPSPPASSPSGRGGGAALRSVGKPSQSEADVLYVCEGGWTKGNSLTCTATYRNDLPAIFKTCQTAVRINNMRTYQWICRNT